MDRQGTTPAVECWESELGGSLGRRVFFSVDAKAAEPIHVLRSAAN